MPRAARQPNIKLHLLDPSQTRESPAESPDMLDFIFSKFAYAVTICTNQNLSREQWIGVSVVVLGAGLMAMRGFGSRTKY